MKDFITRWWEHEPARFYAALVVFINSVIALTVSLDWLPLQADQVSLLYLVVLNGFVVVGGEAVRGRVSPSGRDAVDPEDGDD